MGEKGRIKENESLSRWIKFLITPNELEEKEMDNDEAIKKAKEELEKIQNDEYEQRMAELRMKHIRDSKAIEAFGYDRGLEEGEQKAKKKLAKKLLSKGLKIEEIIEITELTKEEIENI